MSAKGLQIKVSDEKLDISQLCDLITMVSSTYLTLPIDDCRWEVAVDTYLLTPLASKEPVFLDNTELESFNSIFDFEELRNYLFLGDSAMLLLALNTLPTAQLWNEEDILYRGGILFMRNTYSDAVDQIISLTTTYLHYYTAIPRYLSQVIIGVKEPNLPILISNFKLKVIYPDPFYLRTMTTQTTFVQSPSYWVYSALSDMNDGRSPYVAKVFVPPYTSTSPDLYIAADIITLNTDWKLKYKAAVISVMNVLGLEESPIITNSLVAYVPIPDEDTGRRFDKLLGERMSNIGAWTIEDTLFSSPYESVPVDGKRIIMRTT